MTGPALWLAWRELAERKSSFLAGAAMIALASALCTSLELVLRAELAVSTQSTITGAAPDPRRSDGGDLARFDLGTGYLTQEEAAVIGRELSWVRAVEARLLLKEPLEGRGPR